MKTDVIIVNPPLPRNHRRRVAFADMAEVHTFERETRKELWYTKAEYNVMQLAAMEDALELRAMASEGVLSNYLGDRNADDICYTGIEHLLTLACMRQVMASRGGCLYAVLSEQARHRQSAKYWWEAIALASISQSRGSLLRARRLGELHHDSTTREFLQTSPNRDI